VAVPAGPSTSKSYLPAQTDPLIGQTLAERYAIVKKLGEGGMGAVYLATHTLLDKQIALKVLHGEFARKPDLVERFMQEAKAASKIRHENVIDISDFGATPDGLVFFAMELLKGHDLHEEVTRAKLNGQLLPWERSKKIFLQVCAALAAAHKQGVIHRDLKPENVYLVEFLDDHDFVKLLDFGIAKMTEVEEGGRKLTKTGMLFGTPEYMAPEQARGEHVDARVDIYAMGCMLFQLVAGRTPFEAENFMGVLTMHLTEPVPVIAPETFDRIGAPRELEGVIDKALAKDRNARWQTIEDLANAVRAVCGDAPLPAGTTGTTLPRARRESVQAPVATTQPRRRKTQWTGNVSVPVEDDAEPAAAPRAKTKLPLVIGAVVLVAAAGAIGGVMMSKRGGGSTPVAAAGSAGSAGSAAVAAVAPDAALAVVDAAAVEPALPEQVTITIVAPKGAKVTDLASKQTYSADRVVLPGSRTPLSLQLSLKGYRDQFLAVVPDHDQTLTPTLEKTGGGAHPTPPTPPTPPAGDPGPAIKPDPTPPTPPTPPTGKPADDDCTDFPCIKDPLKAHAGSGG
jgi:serine/threonine-protein kinase